MNIKIISGKNLSNKDLNKLMDQFDKKLKQLKKKELKKGDKKNGKQFNRN